MYIPGITPLFGTVIGWIYNLCGQNYMLALILFAVFVKLILLPFGIKQQKNTLKQARLRPMETVIRRRYQGRNDRATQQKMQQEIMELYQQENYNPASGCLPMLIQMPVLFGLYSVIVNPLRYISGLGENVVKVLTDVLGVSQNYDINVIRAVTDMGPALEGSFMNKLASGLSAAGITDYNAEGVVNLIRELPEKHFSVFGIDLTVNPTFALDPYLLIPILTFVFAFISTKVIRKFTYQPATMQEQNKSLAMMDWTMPLLSVWISFSVPAAIAVYWMLQNVLSALQQVLLGKMFPVPEVTDEEIKEAELKLKGRAQNAEAKNRERKLAEPDKDSPIYEEVPDVDFDDGPVVSFTDKPYGVTPKMKARIKAAGRAPKAKRRK